MATWSNKVAPSETHLSSVEDVTEEEEEEEAAQLLKLRLKEVLDTRPAIAAATGSRPGTSQSFRRRDRVRKTLPHRIRPASNEAIRRASSLTRLDIFAEDVQATLELQDVSTENSLRRTDESVPQQPLGSPVSMPLDRKISMRQSSLHLRHRVVQHRKSLLKKQRTAVKTTCWGDLKYVKWPKIKSQVRILCSYRLWKNHIKQVEGHFGTAVVSYFIFLRWLFVMNLVIFALWFGFVCIPQFIHPGELNITSQAACLIPLANASQLTCSNTSVQESGVVFELASNCSNGTQIRLCKFDSDGVAVAESSTQLLTSSDFDVVFDCPLAGSANATQYIVCTGVDPFIIWYQYILDIVSGEGFYNSTPLFHGVYSNQVTPEGYHFPVAFLVMAAIVYFISVALLVYKLGDAYNESYIQLRTDRQVNFCNKLFAAWDFNITDVKTAKLRRAHIRTDFQEELEALRARTTKRTWKGWLLIIFIRFWTNLFVVLCLAGAGAAIFYATGFELDFQTKTSSSIISDPFVAAVVDTIAAFTSAIVISVLNAVLPFVFELVAKAEKYKTASGALKITLLRTIFIRLSSLVVLLTSLYYDIVDCFVNQNSQSGETCDFSDVALSILDTSDIGSGNATTSDATSTCPICWETFIGQQFYRLGLTNMFVVLLSTLLLQTGRNFVSRIKWMNIGKKIGKGTFDIPKSILELIYMQSVLWLGFFFSPLLPAIILLTSFFLFYVKKYSLIWNLEPEKKGFQRSARTNYFFLALMLLALFIAIIPVSYAITQLTPSSSCGPFRGLNSMFEIIELVTNEWACWARIIVDYIDSAAFVIPVIIFLILLCYGAIVVVKARTARLDLMKKQLILEGTNAAHVVGQIHDLVDDTHHRQMVNSVVPLKEAIRISRQYSKSLITPP